MDTFVRPTQAECGIFDLSCIYALTHPETNEIRYIGLTTYLPEERLAGHIETAAKGSQHWVHRWIRTLSVPPLVIVLEYDPFDLNEAEVRWIKQYRESGARLCNMTDGGQGLINPIQETRDKISRTLTGRKMSPEFCHNMSEVHKRRKQQGLPGTRSGCPDNPGSYENRSKAHTGKKRPVAFVEHISSVTKNYWASLSYEERKELGRKISEGILRKREAKNG